MSDSKNVKFAFTSALMGDYQARMFLLRQLVYDGCHRILAWSISVDTYIENVSIANTPWPVQYAQEL